MLIRRCVYIFCSAVVGYRLCIDNQTITACIGVLYLMVVRGYLFLFFFFAGRQVIYVYF